VSFSTVHISVVPEVKPLLLINSLNVPSAVVVMSYVGSVVGRPRF
jgi:hypothetical protein